MGEADDYMRRFGIVPAPAPVAPVDPSRTTLLHAIDKIREGTFYADYDFASGPGLRVLDETLAAMNEFCDRVEGGTIRSKRTYAKFCRIIGRVPK